MHEISINTVKIYHDRDDADQCIRIDVITLFAGGIVAIVVAVGFAISIATAIAIAIFGVVGVVCGVGCINGTISDAVSHAKRIRGTVDCILTTMIIVVVTTVNFTDYDSAKTALSRR